MILIFLFLTSSLCIRGSTFIHLTTFYVCEIQCLISTFSVLICPFFLTLLDECLSLFSLSSFHT